MEAKLAEFRKTHVQKKSSVSLNGIMSRLKSISSFPSTKSSETKAEEEIEEDPIETNWQIIVIKCLVWLTLLIIFIRIEFGVIYVIISLLYFLWSSLGSSSRRRNELSAYSVFNPNFEKLQGTFSAEDYDRQLRRGGSPFFSSSSS
jgi:hypothetical protein